MKIDTEIRHVTKAKANLFLELGFPEDEALKLQAASRQQINDTHLLKEQLMAELAQWIAQHHLKRPGGDLPLPLRQIYWVDIRTNFEPQLRFFTQAAP